MTAGGKAAHVDTYLGENCLRSQGLDARDGTYLFDGGAKGGNGGLHLPVDFSDCRIEDIDLIEVKAQQEAVLLGYAAAQGLSQCLLGSLHPMVGQAGELGRIHLTGDQGLDHLSATHADESLITESNLMLASSRVFWIRRMWLDFSRTSCLRVLSKVRISCV